MTNVLPPGGVADTQPYVIRYLLHFTGPRDNLKIQTAFPFIGQVLAALRDSEQDIATNVRPFLDHIRQFDTDQLHTLHTLDDFLFGEWVIRGCPGSSKSHLARTVILMACAGPVGYRIACRMPCDRVTIHQTYCILGETLFSEYGHRELQMTPMGSVALEECVE